LGQIDFFVDSIIASPATAVRVAITPERAAAFVAAYDAVRRLESIELRLMPALMRAAALRFWTSRLWDLHLPRSAAVLTAHDPAHFERVLLQRRDAPWHHNR
jgi:homoserine kinase type II